MRTHSSDPRTPTEREQLHAHGRWLRDESGHYVILRGVCFGPSAKHEPFLPIHSPEDFERFLPEITDLYNCGLRTLRLPILWEAVEPQFHPTPQYDESFLAQYFWLVEQLAGLGFTIFLDIHQDLYSQQFGGGGFPKWAVDARINPKGYAADTPLWGMNYVLNRGLRKTFRAFWENAVLMRGAGEKPFAIQDRFFALLREIARRCEPIQGVIGIEVINEPHPGELNPETFEAKYLSEFYRKSVDTVRSVSERLLVLLAPQSDWNANVRIDKNYITHLTVARHKDNRLCFAFHYYDSILTGLFGQHLHASKEDEYANAMERGVAEAERLGMAAILSEFGTRQNWNTAVKHDHMEWHQRAIERLCLSATYWNINFYNTEHRRDGFMKEDFSLRDHNGAWRELETVTRPWLMRASTEPLFSSFRKETGEFTVTVRAEGEAALEIYIPTALSPTMPQHYPLGFSVTVSKGEVRDTKFSASKRVFRIIVESSEPTITIIIRRSESIHDDPEA